MNTIALRVQVIAVLGTAGLLGTGCEDAGIGTASATEPDFARLTNATLEAVTPRFQDGVAGQRAQYDPTVRVLDASGAPVRGALIRFAVIEGGGTVSARRVRTDSLGHARVAWTLGSAGRNRVRAGLPQTATLRFTANATAPSVVTDLEISPGSSVLESIGATQQLSAHAFDSSGAVVPDRVGWHAANPAVATVDSTGLVRAVSNGTARVVASSSNGVADTAEITVAQRVTRVVVSPAVDTVAVGSTAQLSAVARDANGHPVAGASYQWSSAQPTIASVGASGLVTGRAAGSATISASADGQIGSASMVVASSTPPGGGAQPFFTDSFEGGRKTDLNGFEWIGTATAGVSDNIGRTGSYSRQFLFGTGADNVQQSFRLGRSLTEIWIEYYLYFPNGTEGFGSAFYRHPNESPSNNKFIRLFSNYSGTYSKMGASLHYATGGASTFDFELATSDIQAGQMTVDGPGFMLVPTDGSRHGRWIQIRQHYRMVSAPGAADAVMQLWVDGQLVIDHRADQGWETTFRYWNQGYLFGSTGADFSVETHVYLDDIRVWDQNPGWQ